MADPFFLSGPGAKRKRPATAAATATAKPTAAKAKKAVGKPNATDRRRTGGARKAVDEELDDEDDDDDDENGGRGAKGSADLDDGAGDVEDRETAAEKRVRLARQYLDTLARPRLVDGDGNADSDGGDDDDDNRDAVATRLLQDVVHNADLRNTGRGTRTAADLCGWEGARRSGRTAGGAAIPAHHHAATQRANGRAAATDH